MSRAASAARVQAGLLAAATYEAGRVAAVGEAFDTLDDAYKARRQVHAMLVQATRNETVTALRCAMRAIALAVRAVLTIFVSGPSCMAPSVI